MFSWILELGLKLLGQRRSNEKLPLEEFISKEINYESRSDWITIGSPTCKMNNLIQRGSKLSRKLLHRQKVKISAVNVAGSALVQRWCHPQVGVSPFGQTRVLGKMSLHSYDMQIMISPYKKSCWPFTFVFKRSKCLAYPFHGGWTLKWAQFFSCQFSISLQTPQAS